MQLFKGDSPIVQCNAADISVYKAFHSARPSSAERESSVILSGGPKNGALKSGLVGRVGAGGLGSH